MAICKHTVSQGRVGEKGSWCLACGEKVLEVETRVCRDCYYFKEIVGGSVCKRHLMGVTPGLHVTFQIEKGTCWTAPVIEKVGE